MDRNFGGRRRVALNQGFPILIPYNLDLVNNGQNILYRTAKDLSTLKLIDQDISLALGKYGNPSSFNVTEAIIITYDNIPKYRQRYTLFKYQVVIATDYTNTFAILNYERLDESGYREVGYGDPSCNYLKHFTRSGDETVLTRTSNVGIAGKHIYFLTQKECMNCKYNILTIIFLLPKDFSYLIIL